MSTIELPNYTSNPNAVRQALEQGEGLLRLAPHGCPVLS